MQIYGYLQTIILQRIKISSPLLHLHQKGRAMLILTAGPESNFDSTYRPTGFPGTRSPIRASHSLVVSMDSPKRRQLAVSLAHRVGEESAAVQIAHWIVLMCEEIATTLAPVLGRSCVVAVYHRSLYLTGSVHPWLSHLHDRIRASMDLLQLKSVLGQQSSGNAAAGGCALLQGIRDLLAGLIGGATTERLLHSVWGHFYSGPSLRIDGPRSLTALPNPTV